MKKILILLGVLVFSSCATTVTEEKAKTEAKQPEIQKLSWLLGNWENLSPEGNSYERWKKISDTQYGGIGFVMVNTDTVFFERLQIEERSDGLYYIPIVKDQNNSEPVPFKLTASANGVFLFENPGHDFPQKIRYKQVNADSVYAEISGMQNGKERVVKFPMRRSPG
ncbi:MAG: DUF6265 family protein [Bacteroidia bacterium]